MDSTTRRPSDRCWTSPWTSNARSVYAHPTNPPPHGVVRNATSSFVKSLSTRSSPGVSSPSTTASALCSERSAGRSRPIAVRPSTSMSRSAWVVDRSGTCPISMRREGGRPSGYSFRQLLSHFWRLVVTSGTRPLRFVSVLGGLSAVAGLLLAAYVLWSRVVQGVAVEGWTSVMIAILVCNGALLFSLGVISEYLGVAVRMAMGRPPYLMVSDPENGPLGQTSTIATPRRLRSSRRSDAMTDGTTRIVIGRGGLLGTALVHRFGLFDRPHRRRLGGSPARGRVPGRRARPLNWRGTGLPLPGARCGAREQVSSAPTPSGCVRRLGTWWRCSTDYGRSPSTA